MRRVVFVSLLLALVFASRDTTVRASQGPVPVAALERFFALETPRLTQYRALRHLEAANPRSGKTAWMDVWTEADSSGFRHKIVDSGGSGYIQSKVFAQVLETERTMWASGAPERAGFNPENYHFEAGSAEDGLARVAVRPRRQDVLLVEGTIFLDPNDGDLVRVQGMLSKAPSIWTRRVQITRRYQRIAGVRLPVSFETVASVLIAGTSNFRMTWQYTSVNDVPVGNPDPAPSGH